MSDTLEPTGLTVTSVTVPSETLGSTYIDIRLGWTNGQKYSRIELDYSIDQEHIWWAVSADITGTATAYTHSLSTLYVNTEINYRIRGYNYSTGWSDWSTTLDTTVWSDTMTETFTLTELYTSAGETNGPGSVAYTGTMAESATMTDAYRESVISKTNIAYMIGTAAGAVHKYGTTWHGDNSAVIPCRWESKEIDFHDAYPQYDGKWKTVDRVWIRYVDRDVVTYNVSLSVDNGATWKTVSRSLGTGTNYVKEANFDFRMTGRMFRVKIEESSTDKDWQITDMELEFYPSGDYFSMS